MQAQSQTSFEEIYRLFLNSISNDYRLKKMFEDDPEIAEDILETWLMKSISAFTDCRFNLSALADFSNKYFTENLWVDEKVILAEFMIYYWLEYNINNIVQMSLTIQDRDFRTHAEERNLSGKSEYADKIREKVYHLVSEYTKKLYPISSWGGNLNVNK